MQLEARIWQLIELVGSIGINGQWQDSHEKDNRKGKVYGSEVRYALAKLGTDILNVVHVLNR